METIIQERVNFLETLHALWNTHPCSLNIRNKLCTYFFIFFKYSVLFETEQFPPAAAALM